MRGSVFMDRAVVRHCGTIFSILDLISIIDLRDERSATPRRLLTGPLCGSGAVELKKMVHELWERILAWLLPRRELHVRRLECPRLLPLPVPGWVFASVPTMFLQPDTLF
jgi:hypothetical protein